MRFPQDVHHKSVNKLVLRSQNRSCSFTSLAFTVVSSRERVGSGVGVGLGVGPHAATQEARRADPAIAEATGLIQDLAHMFHLR